MTNTRMSKAKVGNFFLNNICIGSVDICRLIFFIVYANFFQHQLKYDICIFIFFILNGITLNVDVLFIKLITDCFLVKKKKEILMFFNIRNFKY